MQGKKAIEWHLEGVERGRGLGEVGEEKSSEGANEEAEENAPDCDWLMRIGGKLEYLDVWLEWY